MVVQVKLFFVENSMEHRYYRHTPTAYEGQSLFGFGILVLTLWAILILYLMQDILCSCLWTKKRVYEENRRRYEAIMNARRLSKRRPTLFRDLA